MDVELLFGAAFGFLLALLGWGDQIRGVQERTRSQERDLLNAHRISWRVLRQVIRPSEGASAKDELVAVLGLVHQGFLKDQDDVALLELFRKVDDTRAGLERTYEIRYWLIYSCTVSLFVLGLAALWFSGPVCVGSAITWEQVYAAVACLFLLPILGMTGYAARNEGEFRRGLNEIEDVLRHEASKS